MNKTISRVAAVTCAGFATALIGSTALFAAPVSAASGDAPLYRLYSSNQSDHFYTTSAAERDFAVAHYGYRAEGVTGYVGGSAGAGRTALYRVYSSNQTNHFYTTSTAERDNAVSKLGYRDEGVTGYVDINSSSDNKALLRSYSGAQSNHFYTTNAGERDYAVNSLGYRAEGIMGYVANSNAAPVDPGQNPDPTPTDPTKFDKARISLTFDDSWKSIRANAFAPLNSYGFKSTQYLNSEAVIGEYPDYMSYQEVADFYNTGHELAWHTQTHADLTTQTAAKINTELSIPQAFIDGINAKKSASLPAVSAATFANFATPYGAYNADTTAQLEGETVSPQVTADANYVTNLILGKYSSHRSVDEGYNTKASLAASMTTDKKVKNILVQNILNTTTAAQVKTWIDQAQADNSWLVLVYHQVYTPVAGDVTDHGYDATVENFNAQLATIKSEGIAVETVAQALAELKAQM